jgi:transcriptional regulator with XRE-family HTH domain
MPPRKHIDPVEKHVGTRVRLRRTMLEMRMETLAKELNLTFQQVRKYETGTNRIAASRLQQISRILEVPVTFFFEDAPGSASVPITNVTAASLNTFLISSEGKALVKAFSRIESRKLRYSIVQLV